MQSALDQAISDAAAKEATLAADDSNLANINTAIQTATSPLAPAQTQRIADATAFNASMDALSAAALAAKVSVS